MQALPSGIRSVLALVVLLTLSCEKGEEEEWSPSWPCTDYYLDADGAGWVACVPSCGESGTFKSCSFSSGLPPDSSGGRGSPDYPGTDPLPPGRHPVGGGAMMWS